MAEFSDIGGGRHRPRSKRPRMAKGPANKPTPSTRDDIAKMIAGEKAALARRKRAPVPRGVDEFVQRVRTATPLELVEIERRGVPGQLVKDLAKQLHLPAIRLFDMLQVAKATIEKKSASGEVVVGSGAYSAVGMARLLAIAQDIVANSTAAEAKHLDVAKWLGRWLERPQPSLGGRAPGALLDTPTGVAVVSRLLGAIESGAYQ